MILILVGVSMSPVLLSSILLFKRSTFRLVVILLINGGVSSFALAAGVMSNPLTLEKAVTLALQNDPWLSGSRYQQQATAAMAESAFQLPDPNFSLKMANLPTDTLDFNQEGMTQLVAGVSQMYPRGDSRRLMREQLHLQSGRQPFMRLERQEKLRLTITQLWLDAYQAKQSVRLIENDRKLFDQLVDISLASYSSGLRGSGQQDLIKAQLEQSRIEDRLTMLRQKQDVAEQKLLEWLLPSVSDFAEGMNGFSGYTSELPVLSSHYTDRFEGEGLSNRELSSYLVRHPSIQIVDQSIAAAGTAVQLAKQQYQPQWGVNASYGYRGEDPTGRDRADLFSVGVTLSMPLFSSTGQDKEVEAAISRQEKIRTERSLILRQMIASFHSARTQLDRLEQRREIFDNKLLPQVKQQAEAALNAYESDNGSFIEVVRARIAELNTRIEYLGIKIARLKQIAQTNYLLTTTESSAENITLSQEGVTP